VNRAQKYTARGIAIGALGFVLLIAFLIVVELHAVAVGGHSTISELVWLVWARQPWIVLLISHVLAAPFWYLAGHFTAQSQETYDRIRREGL